MRLGRIMAIPVLLILTFGSGLFPSLALSQSTAPEHPQPQLSLPEHPRPQSSAGSPRVPQRADTEWPREAYRGDEKISMYQPQLERWEGDELRAYAALSVSGKNNKTPKYGVVWFRARTEVDKVNRQVTLTNFQITKVKFPSMPGKEADYQAFLQAKLLGKTRFISLDRLEAALAASESEQAQIKGLRVKNEPPRIIFASKPSMLVLIDGSPQFRDVGGTDLRLMLNARATILLDTKTHKYYLNVMDGWLHVTDLVGTWSYVDKYEGNH